MSGGEITTYNGGGDFLALCGHFTMDGDHAGMLLGLLPPIFHIREESDKAVLRWTLERMRQEMFDPQPRGFWSGSSSPPWYWSRRCGCIWRRSQAAASAGSSRWPINGWAGDQSHAQRPRASMDLRIFGDWRRHVANSLRSQVQGNGREIPLDYLTHWRMLLAGDRLANSGDPISVIAPSLCYDSESAFSTAFKRVMGCSPRQYKRGRDLAPPSQTAAEGSHDDQMKLAAIG